MQNHGAYMEQSTWPELSLCWIGVSPLSNHYVCERTRTHSNIQNWHIQENTLKDLIHDAILVRENGPGMPGMFSPPPRVSDPDMHHGTCVTHVPSCVPGSLISGFLWSRWRGNRSWHSRRIRNPKFYASGKRSIYLNMLEIYLETITWDFFVVTFKTS